MGIFQDYPTFESDMLRAFVRVVVESVCSLGKRNCFKLLMIIFVFVHSIVQLDDDDLAKKKTESDQPNFNMAPSKCIFHLVHF